MFFGKIFRGSWDKFVKTPMMAPLGYSNKLDKSDICVDDLHAKHVFKYASKIFKVVFGSQPESE